MIQYVENNSSLRWRYEHYSRLHQTMEQIGGRMGKPLFVITTTQTQRPFYTSLSPLFTITSIYY